MTNKRDRARPATTWRRIKYACVGWVGTMLIRMLMSTLRLRFELPDGGDKPAPPGDPVIFALWHSRLFILIYAFRGRGATVLISKHRDGEYIARVASRLGFLTSRGSTRRGGAGALRELLDILDAGKEVALTPDGPRGPRLVLQDGVVYAAEKSGCPIIPVAAAARRCWRMPTWDHFIVPKPFTTAVVRLGEPIAIPPDLTDEQRKQWRLNVEDALLELTRQADRDVGIHE